MPLTAAQTAAQTYITTSTDDYAFGGTTHTVSEWYTLGADNAVIAAMNDLAFGVSQSRTAAPASIDASTIKAAIAESADFGSMLAASGVMTALDWLISETPVPAARYASITAGPLDAYTNAKAAFTALTVVDATIWQALSNNASAPAFSQSDMTEIRNA